MSKFRILLQGSLLVTAALVLTTCQPSSSGGSYSPSPGAPSITGNPCLSGTAASTRNAPIVCVDDTAATLSVSPDPINAHRSVVLHWWAQSNGTKLNVEIQPGCVTDVKCNGPHCMARTVHVETQTRCKYDVWTDKHPRLDPDIVIDPCC